MRIKVLESGMVIEGGFPIGFICFFVCSLLQKPFVRQSESS